jgi:N-acetyl-beta-hexosaminidase
LTACFENDPIPEPLDVTEPAVQDFVDRLYREIGPLFPDEWIHVGGDEGTNACAHK